jgi:Tfp pilus assembly protein PilF
MALSKEQRYKEASEKFTQAVMLSLDTHRYHQALHLNYVATRRGDQGIQFYKNLIREHPKNGVLHYWLGRFYLDQRLPEEAAREFKEASLLAPQDKRPFISLGLTYLQMGKEQEGMEAYLRANKLDPRVAAVHVGLGHLYFKRNDHAKAQKEYEEALEIDPSFGEARNNLGLIYEKKGELSKAEEQWKKVIEEDPNAMETRERLARLYFNAKRYRNAAEEYSTLSQMRPNSPEIFFALGESQMRLVETLTDPDERDHFKGLAADAFRWTLELNPKHPQAGKYLARLNSEKSPSRKK